MPSLKRIKDPAIISIISVVLSLLFGSIGLYTFIYEPEPDISIELISAISVLDINKSVNDLNILFQGQDIEKSNLSLKILSIRFTNTGETDLTEYSYDKQDTLGLQVINGRLIEARVTSTNYDYLLPRINPRILNEHLLQIDKIIFERGKYFILELIVLHDKDQLPEVLHVGKIAGIDDIQVIDTWDTEDSASFISELFSGGTLVQIVRPLVYIVSLIIIIVILVIISESWSGWKRNRITERRRQLIAGLLPNPGESPQSKSIVDFVRKTFERDGLKGLKRAQTLLSDDKKLKERVELHQLQKKIDNLSDSMHQLRYRKSDIEHHVTTAQGETIYFQPSYYQSSTWGLSDLIDTGIVSIDKDGVETDMDLLNLLDSATRHFEENGPKNI